MTKTPTKKEIEKQYKIHRSVQRTADHFGVKSTRMKSIMEDKGIEAKRMPKYVFSKTQLTKLYKNSTLTEVASRFGCDSETIRRQLISYGIERH